MNNTTNVTTAAATATPTMRVNGVDYPSVVAIHIPKYYFPKPHLKRQKYGDSFVLQCWINIPSTAAMVRNYCFDAQVAPKQLVASRDFCVTLRLPSSTLPRDALNAVLSRIQSDHLESQSDMDNWPVIVEFAEAGLVSLRKSDPTGDVTANAIPFDQSRPIQEQLSLPFATRLGIDVNGARRVLRERSAAEAAKRLDDIAALRELRDARVQEVEDARRAEEIAAILRSKRRDGAVRDRMIASNSYASREVQQWRKEKVHFERAHQRESAERAHREAESAENERWRAMTIAHSHARCGAVLDEEYARKAVVAEEAADFAAIQRSVTDTLAKAQQRSRIRAHLGRLRIEFSPSCTM